MMRWMILAVLVLGVGRVPSASPGQETAGKEPRKRNPVTAVLAVRG